MKSFEIQVLNKNQECGTGDLIIMILNSFRFQNMFAYICSFPKILQPTIPLRPPKYNTKVISFKKCGSHETERGNEYLNNILRIDNDF